MSDSTAQLRDEIDRAIEQVIEKGERAVIRKDGKEVAALVPIADLRRMEGEAAEKKPIWEIAADLGAQIPDEEWAKVPSDLSMNLDHYLYGAPKAE